MAKGLICFDMDNTLLYSDEVHVVAFNRAFRKNGLPKVPRNKILEYFGLVARVMVRKLFPGISDSKLKAVVRDHDLLVVRDTAKYARLVPGVKRALSLLKAHYKLALLSNCKHAEVIATIKAVGIAPSTFVALIGNDEVRHPKPAPDEIRLAMKKAHLRKGYVVGDTVYDIKAGKAAGLKTVAVLTGHHSRARLKREKPDHILKSVVELPKLLLG